MNSIEEAQEREKEARRHGRHIKLEQELNAIGLSLFAPPFSDFRAMLNNCEVCQQPVLDAACIKFPDGRLMHWECFFELGHKLEEAEKKEKEER